MTAVPLDTQFNILDARDKPELQYIIEAINTLG